MRKEYKLGELLTYEQPTPYIVESTKYDDSYKIPVLTAGKTFIIGYTNETSGIYSKLPAIIFDDFTTSTQFVNFKFKVKSSAMKILSPNQELVLPKYIFYQMQVINIDHSTHRRYWIQRYSKIKVKIPSLDEQKRILAHIEELFSELDNAESTLLKIKEQLVLYKNSILNHVLSSNDVKSIKECIVEMGQGWSPKCEKKNVISDDEWAVITTTAIQPMSFHPYENKRLPKSLEPRIQHEIHVGDILITRAGPRSRCGICCMVKKTKKRLINCDKVYMLHVNNDIIIPEYLEVVLNAPSFQKKIAFCKTGGNDSGVNLTQSRFLNILIPVPSIEKQKTMLRIIDERMTLINSIEATVNTSLQQIYSLRHSILNKVFEGGLS